MIRSRVLGALTVLGLAVGLGLTAAGPAAAAPQLSDGCATLHSASSSVITTDNSVFLSPQQYAKGERLTFVGTTDVGVTPKVTVNYPSEDVQGLSVSSGKPIRFTVPFDTALSFRLTSDPQSSVSWRIDCGLPPTAAITSPADGQTFAAGQVVATSYSCTGQTNAVASCVDSNGDSDGSGVLNTETVGAHTYSVTATDSAGLTSARSISYTIAKKTQSVSFTSPPPSGADWFYGDFHGSIGYVAKAQASSGLPVTYSVDPASAGICSLDGMVEDNPIYGTGMAISLDGAGTCTIHAVQVGNDEYLPSAQATQSFEIQRVPTWLEAAKAGKGVLGLTPSTFSATLYVPYEAGGPFWGLEGYPGQVVTFSVAWKAVCSATTNSQGVATCKVVIGLANAFAQSTYTASYAGDKNYKPATATGKLGG